jgi:hypothetical protein
LFQRAFYFILSLSFTSCFLLTSCGFNSLYRTEGLSDGSREDLASIAVEIEDSIGGTEFHRFISNILIQSSPIKYLLRVKFTNSTVQTVIDKNSDIVRQAVSQSVQYQLIDIKSDKTLTSGSFRHSSSYSNLSSAFASYVGGEKELENLTKRSAEDIRIRLILYFGQNSKNI